MKKRKQKPQRRPKQAAVKTPQSKGLLYKAIPSHAEVRARMTDRGSPAMVFPGRLVFSNPLEVALEKRAGTFWHVSGNEPEPAQTDWVINLLADADHYPLALGYLAKNYADQGIRVFNPPEAVMRTRRHAVPHFLAGIDNLTVPRCERFLATDPKHFLQAFELGKFTFPVLIRPAGSHTGKELLVIESQEDWHKIYTIPWGGRDVYITQWTDFQSAEGEWRKLRLSITREGVRLRHILYGDGWLVHATTRGPEEVEKELEVLLSDDKWEVIQKLGQDIRKCLGMDWVGADVGWKSDDEFVLFEANASMSILSQANMPEFRRDDYLASWKRVEKDVEIALGRFIRGEVAG